MIISIDQTYSARERESDTVRWGWKEGERESDTERGSGGRRERGRA